MLLRKCNGEDSEKVTVVVIQVSVSQGRFSGGAGAAESVANDVEPTRLSYDSNTKTGGDAQSKALLQSCKRRQRR